MHPIDKRIQLPKVLIPSNPSKTYIEANDARAIISLTIMKILHGVSEKGLIAIKKITIIDYAAIAPIHPITES